MTKMTPNKSAIFRLSIIIASAILSSSLIAMVAIYVATANHLEANLKTLIEADLKGYSELYAQRRIIAVRQAFERRANASDASKDLYLLLDKKGKKLAGNIDRWPIGLPKDNSWQEFSITRNDAVMEKYLGAGASLPGGFPILVARSTAPNEAVLAKLRWTIGISILAILIVSVFLGRLLGNYVVGRITRVNDVCLDVELGNIKARVLDDTSDEFGALAAHINKMLDRISSLMQGTREISDRIAHELRTPLNRILLRIESIQEAPQDGDLKDELDKVSSDLREIIEVFEELLDIAETEAGSHDNANFIALNLAELVADMVSLYQVIADEKSITVTANIDEHAFVLGDKNLLTRAIANLLDNALKFSPEGGVVNIRLICGEPLHRLEIADNGPGLESDFKEQVFDRFSRGANVADKPGHGLGLAIVQAIAIRHGIKITLIDNNPGLRVTLTCPAYSHQNSTN